MSPKQVVFWATLVSVIGADQLTKRLAVRLEGELVVIPHLLSFAHAENPAAAFGLLHGDPNRYLYFAVFTGVVCLVLLGWYRRMDADDRLQAGAVALLIGGTAGNAIDRVEKRTVTDWVKVWTDVEPVAGWLDATFGTTVWPMFNVADAALVVGVLVFFGHALSHDGDDTLTEDEAATGG